MTTFTLTAITKADEKGIRTWDVEWFCSATRRLRGQFFRCTEKAYVDRKRAEGHKTKVVIPSHLL